MLDDGFGDIQPEYSCGDGVHINQKAFIDISKEAYQQNRDLFDGFNWVNL